MEACCTCASLLSSVPSFSDSEKPLPQERWLECCGRVICGRCIHNNKRFANYCPYCQIAQGPSTLPQGLKEPPSYTSVATAPGASLLSSETAPPPYSARARSKSPPVYAQPNTELDDEKAALKQADSKLGDSSLDGSTATIIPTSSSPSTPAEDTLHFLDHAHDTVTSLSLRYGVPAPVLRRANRLHSDHLLAGRRAIVIPGSHYAGGVSLSPRPVGGEGDEARKGRIRRWMVATKVADYDVALLYLEQAGDDLDAALETYFADEAWEKENPLEGSAGGSSSRLGKGKRVLRSGGPWARQAAFLWKS